MRKFYLQEVIQLNKFASAFSGISTLDYLLTLHNRDQFFRKAHEAISSVTGVDFISI